MGEDKKDKKENQKDRISTSLSLSVASSVNSSIDSLSNNKSHDSFQKNFILQDELGRGGFGFVYRCVNKQTRHVYAVKMNIDPKDMEDLKQEYMIINEICHPSGHANIVNVIACIADDQIIYNIYELASGGDLNFHLKQNVCKLKYV